MEHYYYCYYDYYKRLASSKMEKAEHCSKCHCKMKIKIVSARIIGQSYPRDLSQGDGAGSLVQHVLQ